ncbi:MAG: hypothetical protein SH850_20825 [Planctomycetaceae bacterium]|nr:hypothetical protein [Planctomycetaceae bacterium]
MIRVTACVILLLAATSVWSAEGKLTAVKSPPAGLSDAVKAALAPTGQQVSADGAAVCTVWLAKSLAVKDGFKPSSTVKYPFTPGQFIGVMLVEKKSEFTDFRGQEVAAGAYTLRYGQQPVDGNHVGTSELYDFLLAVPAATDADPAAIKTPEDLFKRSAKTAGSNHPAIYSLLPPAAEAQAAAIEHDSGKEYWILTVLGQDAAGKAIPMKLIVVGKSEA